MPHFLLKLIAPRRTFAMDMDAQERAMMPSILPTGNRTATRWSCSKGRYGAGVIAAADEAAARAFADADPAIKSNRGFVCEVYPMRAVTRAATTSA